MVHIILLDNIPLDKFFKRPQLILCVQKAREQNKFIYQSPDGNIAVVCTHICSIYMARKHQRILKLGLVVVIMQLQI